MKIRKFKDYETIYEIKDENKRRLATVNLDPGHKVYDEELIKMGEEELRTWDPFRSKLAAALLNGLDKLPLRSGSKVLYLGAASGTTSSHISDIIGNSGRIYCVEFSPRSARDLLNVCERRMNMIPILTDARFPQNYSYFCSNVDFIYCDVAQPEQAIILVNNAKYFLKEKGYVMIAVKARSIDVTKKPSEVFKKEIEVLEANNFKIVGKIRLEPYTADHIFISAIWQEYGS
ncbi:MAG: fibrillarin-like rRNA/tRNA 2'-O-methyltransferase [Candidatus Odinarchaeia archaeon]